MKEYYSEQGKLVDLDKLKNSDPFLSQELYEKIHENLSILVSDVLIYYDGGFLLLKRTKNPAQSSFFFCGGRVLKGVPIKDFLEFKALKECGLKIGPLLYVHASREFYQGDPFGHEKGTDTGGFRYIAVGKGNIKLDKDHDSYIIVTPKNYDSMRDSFYPLMRDMLDIGMFHLKKAKEQNISFEKYISQQSEMPILPLE